jgi:hypothetical protein
VKRHAKAPSAGSNTRQGGRLGAAALLAVASCLLVLVLGGSAGAAGSLSLLAKIGSRGSGPSQFEFNGPSGIAVDNTNGASKGFYYVADPTNHRVQKFDPWGQFVLMFGRGVNQTTGGNICIAASGDTCQAGTEYAGTGTGDSVTGTNGNFSAPKGVAVDNAGNVYVTDSGNNRVQKFDSTGNFILMWGGGVDQTNADNICTAAGGETCGPGTPGTTASQFSANAMGPIATRSSNGNVYVGDKDRVQIFNTSGSPQPQISLTGSGNVTALGVDQQGAAYVTTSGFFSKGAWKFNAAGAFQNLVFDQGGSPTAIVARSNSDVFIADDTQIREYDGSAGLQASFGSGFGRASALAFSGTSANNPVGNLDLAIADGTGQQIVLLGPAPTSTPPPAAAPSVTGVFVSHLGTDNVDVTAQINSNFNATTYYLEYGAGDCSSNPCTQIPTAPGRALGAVSNQPVSVTLQIEGLQPSTLYHYRLMASSDAGTTASPDATFTTRAPVGVSELPEGRGYEMVSPPDKNGGNVMTEPLRTRAAIDGNAASFASLAGFGNVEGSGVNGTEYLSERSPGGWSTHPITPNQPTHWNVAQSANFPSEFSPDLSTGVFFATKSIPGLPPSNTDKLANLYLATGMRGGPGDFELLSDAVAPTPPLPFTSSRLAFSDATPSFDQVGFENEYNLTQDAIDANLPLDKQKAYVWDQGAVDLVGVLPDGTPAEQSVIGNGMTTEIETSSPARIDTKGNSTRNAISDDGSQVVFTVGPLSEQSAGPFAVANDIVRFGTIYRRIDGTASIQVNASEKTNGGGPGGTDAAGPQPAAYMAATPDGERIAFLTAEQLINDDENGAMDLYLYDRDEPAGSRLTLASKNEVEPFGVDEGARFVVDMSQDGSFVYFISGTRLLSSDPGLSDEHRHRLYVWHDGELRLIASLDEFEHTWGDFGLGADVFRPQVRVTPDGHSVVFVSHNPELLPPSMPICAEEHGPAPCSQLIHYNYDADQNVCVSCGDSGATIATEASNFTQYHDAGLPSGVVGVLHRSHPLTNDGSKVFFNTRSALVPQDTNGQVDVYVYDVPSGSVRLLSTGQSNTGSYFAEATPDGSDVFITTRQQLVRMDIDRNADLYDVRVGGGIAAQDEPPPFQCVGDSCLSPINPPNDPTPSSSSFDGKGNGNAEPVAHAKKRRAKKRCRGVANRKQKRHGRCVQRKKKQKKSTPSQARSQGGQRNG